MDREELKAQLKKHEGVRSRPYADTVGKITIGVGHNLDDKPLTPMQIDRLLDDDVDDVMREIGLSCPWFESLSPRRQLVIADMVFNLGMPRFLEFKRTIAAVRDGRYDAAAMFMLESKWARQVGQRAKTLAGMMRAG